MKKEYPELESLSDFIISDVPKVIVDDVTISDHAEYVVDIKRLKAQGLQVNDIVGMRDGKIVITGRNLNISHIAVIDRRGEILQQKNICYSCSGHGTTHCCYLSEFKVIAVFDDEIITWDVRDGSCKKKKMRDTISCWVLGMKAISVTTDPDNNHIFVGTNSKYVYELDDQLTYRHTITLPLTLLYGNMLVMNRAVTLSVHKRNLLVLDHNGKKAYAVTTGEANGNVIYAFKKPDCVVRNVWRNDWRPVDVCTDMNMFIYMLWNNTVKCVLTQYSQDGRKLLNTKSLDMICNLLTTLKEDGEDKLVIESSDTQRLYIYGLNMT
ncbi:hypothetical protein BSL78_26100 [Apostichopus japonicus]|uniref:Uncharacterized protein n=1 Tax=Stichopus japonicus TaxID=307972 RepID=A0A2G8JMS1_STIJA|nr:hypothetical protein BSL78_26100 [Apostichopus japonicus]